MRLTTFWSSLLDNILFSQSLLYDIKYQIDGGYCMRMDYNGYTLDSDERHLVSSILDCIDECLVNYPGLECTSVC